MLFRRLLLTLFLSCLLALPAAAQETKIKWFGHAAFSITTPKGKILLIDPWLKNPLNPAAKEGKDPFAAVPKVDYILLTHGHRDHVATRLRSRRKPARFWFVIRSWPATW